MKKSYLTVCFLLSAIYSFALNETVCVITNTGSSGQACTASSLGFVDPCSTLGFVVNYNIPTSDGFVVVAKFEWFVNGVLVKTTTNATDPVLLWQIKASNTNVQCKVTYRRQDGTLSPVFTSNTFAPNVKSLNFGSIATTTAPPNYGCTANPVSYSLNTVTCTGQFCSSVFNATQYQISWQPPNGWTQSNISPNGNNVSFLPDASSGGTLIATIRLPCGYSETRAFIINRVAEKPVFLTSNNTICSSSASYSINPICGAIDYTYTIVGNSGITFTSNGLQTITTSNTNVNLNLSGGSSAFSLKAKANYPNSIVSTEESVQLLYGIPYLDLVTFSNGANEEQYFCTSHYGNEFQPIFSFTPENSAIEYRILSWPGLNVVYTDPNQYPVGMSIPMNYMATSGSYVVLEIKLTTPCGSTSWLGYEVEYVDCSEPGGCFDCPFRLAASPNPTDGDVNVTIEKEKPEVKAMSKNEKVRYMLIDVDRAQVMKQWTFNNDQNRRTLNVRGIKSGRYILVVTKGKYRQSIQIIIK